MVPELSGVFSFFLYTSVKQHMLFMQCGPFAWLFIYDVTWFMANLRDWHWDVWQQEPNLSDQSRGWYDQHENKYKMHRKTQLTITLYQWEPCACFCATKRSHLGVTGDREARSAFLMSSLFRDFFFLTAVTAENPASQTWKWKKGFQCCCCLKHTFKSTVIFNLQQLIFLSHGQTWFTWFVHKWVADPFLHSSRVFCGWDVALKLL